MQDTVGIILLNILDIRLNNYFFEKNKFDIDKLNTFIYVNSDGCCGLRAESSFGRVVCCSPL